MLDLSVTHRLGLYNGQHNVGRILEAMLYYDRVHLILSAQTFSGLWAALGPGDLGALLSHGSITSSITPEHLGIINNNRNGVVTHSQVMFKLAGREGKKIHDKDDIGTLLGLVENLPNAEQASRNKIERIIKNSSKTRYEEILGGSRSSASRLLSLVSDADTLKIFLRGYALANNLNLNQAAINNCKIETIDMGDDFFISSSILLEEMVPGWNDANGWGSVLTSVQDYAVDLYLSNMFAADIVTTPEISGVASERLDLSLQRSQRSSDQISAFEDMVFDDAHIFADAYNEGIITFQEALKIIDESRKFRVWTKSLPPDSSLIKEYQKAISKETLLSKLPVSLLRFSMFNSAGMIADAYAPGSGVIVSAIDTFVVEKILGGWRPNIFVRNVRKKLEIAEKRSFLN